MPTSESSSSTEIWQASEALEIYNEDKQYAFTCSGDAVSQGRRCRRDIGKNSLVATVAILDRMSCMEPREASRDGATLKVLAHMCLCGQNHRTDHGVRKLMDKWQQVMQEEQERIDRKRRINAIRLLIKLELNGDLRPTEYATLVDICEKLGGIEEDEFGDEEASERVDDAVEDESEADSEEETEDEVEDEVEEEEQEEEDDENEEEEEEEHEDDDEDESAESTTSTHGSVECTDHVSRRTTDEECPICREDMADNPLTDLVWCKASCGRSIHRDCFDQWEAVAAANRRTLNCVICRATWQPPCEHDDGTTPA